MVLFLMALFLAPPAAGSVEGQTSSPPPIVVEGKKPERKICKTKAEWDFEEAEADRHMSRENQRTNALNSQLLNEQNAFAGKKPH